MTMSPRVYRSGTQGSHHSSSSRSYDSDDSRSTAPTVYSGRPAPRRYETADGRIEFDEECYFGDDNPRESTETYASTLPSSEDLPEEPQYQVPEGRHEVYDSDAIPTNPQSFARLFPSCRTLLIGHDDATIDGNMNLRVDTEVQEEDGIETMTLFHLKMQDLKNRQFSFRRYCRESGREVCHSNRKYMMPAEPKRPGLQRSLSNALSSITNLRPKSDNAKPTFNLKRQDSGYDTDDDNDDFDSPIKKSQNGFPIPTNTIQIEFSNYAHVDVKRRGAKTSKRYEFEYWGSEYMWKREILRIGHVKEVSYTLINCSTSRAIAHITPLALSAAEAREEEAMGGWIPPCSMRISDPSIFHGLTDVADVIVATGLVALVDDNIKRRWHSKRSLQLTLPTLPPKLAKLTNRETSAPKRMIDEVFRGHGGPTATHRPHIHRQATIA